MFSLAMPDFIATVTPGYHKAEMHKLQERCTRQILLPGRPHLEQVSHKPEFIGTCAGMLTRFMAQIFKEAHFNAITFTAFVSSMTGIATLITFCPV